ncbi:MAG: YraN family protein [Betaproteobacteria bacterium]
MSFLRRPPLAARPPKQRAGAAAEEAAVRLLQQHGCTIVARNARFREGELDIVAREGELILFVEVRRRRDNRFGGAGASVDHFKRRRLLRAAQHFLLQNYGDGIAPGRRRGAGGWPACRFDVVTADDQGVTEWIRDAFQAD